VESAAPGEADARRAGSPPVGRREILHAGLAALAVLVAPGAAEPGGRRQALALAFRNLHTGELVRRTYWADGRFDPEALRDIDRLLRDHRTDEVRPIDRRLLRLLSALRSRLDTGKPFEVVSGYRSPASNALLRRTTSGVAADSLHVQGMAVDVRVPDRPLAAVRAAAIALRGGGVGYYPESGFVHLDVGRVRVW
jgi:uncharacterized protein YcbK (DUF882 family)